MSVIVNFILFIVAVYLVGYSFILIFFDKDNDKSLSLLAPAIGVALCSIISAIIYLRLGLPIMVVRYVYAVLGMFSLFIVIIKLRNARFLIPLAGILLVFLIMICPGLIRGEKYYVHKGNIWDKYFYLSEVAYMTNHDLAYGEQDMNAEEYPSDILQFGYGAIYTDRPVVPLLCAALTTGNNIYICSYFFINMLWSFILGPMILTFMRVFGHWNTKKCVVLSLIYLGGFFAQLQADIDAWSQMCGAALLLAFTILWLGYLKELIFGKVLPDLKFIIGMSIIGTGMFLIYPEGTFVYGLLLTIATIIIFARHFNKAHISKLLKCVSIPCLMLLGAYIVHSNTVRFAFFQANDSTSEVRQSWASYFDKYWLGYHKFSSSGVVTGFIKKAMTIVPSWSGMFMLTPKYKDISHVIVAAWLLAMGIITFGIISIWIAAVIKVFRQKYKENYYLNAFLTIGIISAVVFLFLVFTGKYWTAGKILMYVSPFTYLVLISPVEEIRNMVSSVQPGMKKIQRNNFMPIFMAIISLIFVASQAMFTGMRVYDIATNENCTGYLGNYPSDQWPKLKRNYKYSFNACDYENEDVVAVCIDEEWYQAYIKIELAYNGIPYYSVPDAVFYGSGYKEQQPEIREGDIRITE